MKIVYIAGPFSATTELERNENCTRMERVAAEVWRLGAVAVNPNGNSRHLKDFIPYRTILEGDLVLLSRCDAVMLVKGWATSHGALKEIAHAQSLGIPVFKSYVELRKFLKGETIRHARTAKTESRRFTIPSGTTGFRRVSVPYVSILAD